MSPRRSKTYSNEPQGEVGSTLLFVAAVVIPFLFFTLSLGIDIAMFFHEKKQAQAMLDQAGLHVQRFFPYIPEAIEAFDLFVEERPLLQQGNTSMIYDPQVQVSDIVTLRYERAFRPFFANLIAQDLRISLAAESQVRTTPFRAHIALDASSYLAPPIDHVSGWTPGAEVPAELFAQGIISFAHDFDGDQVAELVVPLVASQQCFSAPLRALKAGAVRLYQYLASFRDNQVGVSVYPSGSGGFLDVLQPVSPTLPPEIHPNPNTFHEWNSPFVRNEHCAAASERESMNEQFAIPISHDSFYGLWKTPPGSGYVIDQVADWQVDPLFQEISGEMLLWSQSVRSGMYGDTPNIIRSMALSLFANDDRESLGGMRGKSVRQAILLAGDLPWSQGVRLVDPESGDIRTEVTDALRTVLLEIGDVVASYPEMNFHIYYLTFFHEGTVGSVAQFENGLSALQTLVDTILQEFTAEVRARMTWRVLGVNEAEGLSDELLTVIALNRRGGVIAR
ncbi:MAG: hypothetical protein ACO3XO_05365 [Bdellovibrionota bacterium]